VRLFGNNPRYERWRWQILTITWLAYAGFYCTRTLPRSRWAEALDWAVFCLKNESSYLALPKQLCMGGDDGLTCRKSARFRRTQSEKVVLQARPFDLES